MPGHGRVEHRMIVVVLVPIVYLGENDGCVVPVLVLRKDMEGGEGGLTPEREPGEQQEQHRHPPVPDDSRAHAQPRPPGAFMQNQFA